MPKMDGLQVLTIARRKFPRLRTAVLSSVIDEQFRTRAYSLGIDLFLQKPQSAKEVSFVLECVESILERERISGFRGVQNKSLVDLIQLECLSQSCSLLKITHGTTEGKIWFQNGEIIDAEAQGIVGEAAFQKILAWQSGNFEVLPPDEDRTRTIFASYQGLLLETAHVLDENQARHLDATPESTTEETLSKLADLAQISGVEFILAVSTGEKRQFDVWGVENPDQLADWTRDIMGRFRGLGEKLQAGTLKQFEAGGPHSQLAISSRNGEELCVGFHRSMPQTLVRETMKIVVAKWDF